MTGLADSALLLLPQWGAGLVGLATFLACLALPVPASLLMLAAGALVAAGDLGLLAVLGSAFGGAVTADQLGYRIGRRIGRRAGRLIAGAPSRRARLLADASQRLRDRGTTTVFLTRWLFSPLGPWVNFAAGAAGHGLGRFTLASAAGEAIWVGAYVTLGLVLGANLQAAAGLADDIGALLMAGTVAGFLALRLWRRARATRAAPPAIDPAQVRPDI